MAVLDSAAGESEAWLVSLLLLSLLMLFLCLFYWTQYVVALLMLLLRRPVICMDEQGITVHDALNFFNKHRRWSAKWGNITEIGRGEENLKRYPYIGMILKPRSGVLIKRRHVAYGEERNYVVVSSNLMPGQEEGVRQAVLAAWRRYKASISDKIPYTAQTIYHILQEDFGTLIWFLDETPQFVLLDLEEGVPTKYDLVYLYQFKRIFKNEKIKIHYNRLQRQLKITQEDGISRPKYLPAIEAEMLRIVNLHLYD